MNIRRLQYFIAVVEHGTVTAAAEVLHIAQPALSRQLKTLERELRIELFQSAGNRLVLTNSGRAFVPMARKLLAESRDLDAAVQVLRTGQVQRLSCAATTASLRGFLSNFIAELGPDQPTIVARETGHFELESALLDDLDFIITPTIPTGDLATVMLGDVPIRAQVPAGHRWLGESRRGIELSELVDQPLILSPEHSVSRRIFSEALERQGLRIERAEVCDDGLVSHALVASGRGIAVNTEYPAFGVRGIPLFEQLGVPDASPLMLHMYMAWRRGHYAEAKLRELASGLMEMVGGRQESSDVPGRNS